ncbi:DUF4328 domain-containing protein [Kitasatospora sp. NPDC001539]|uniref:DUF4328 domain-containing protein n=1 Tax=Kitasatospora sp. NPDC001539 TaxID=3154384 RepID=UPI00333466F6
MVAAVAVAVDVWSDVLLGRLTDGAGDVGLDEFDAVGSVANTVNDVFITLALATAVVFIVWFYRVRKNADLLVPNGHRRGRGWTIGAWFTPVVLLWFPWQLMVDCWRASAPLDAEGRRRAPSENVLVVWWSTWIGSLIVGRIAHAMMGHVNLLDPVDLESVRTSTRVEVAGSVLRLVAAFAAIVVVNRLTAMQQARRTEVNPLAARAAQEARVRALVQPLTAAAPAEAPRDIAPEGQSPA